MADLVFAKAFRRHVDCPDASAPGDDLRSVLDHYFADHPGVRGYVLDDAGAVRKHIAVFVDGDLITDRLDLTDPVEEHSTIHVFQALSGG
ncbi:MAG: thiamine biosynthesis protein ThiS [Acidimicrobiaceae bacterium]|nr:thiamine biosynthesis protein ThiS [Acidimicrobiaceae bacterium]